LGGGGGAKESGAIEKGDEMTKSSTANAADNSQGDMDVVLKGTPLDFELCELLGEKPADFLVLCFDGIQLEDFGTPYDTPKNRADRLGLVERLNDRSAESLWPEMWRNRKPSICKQFGLPETTTAEDFRPLVSCKIARVCHGYSSHTHCAIGLLERLIGIIERWGLGNGSDGAACVEIRSKRGVDYGEIGEGLPLVIGLAVKRLLIAEGPTSGHQQ
jgi:hypothetical protein